MTEILDRRAASTQAPPPQGARPLGVDAGEPPCLPTWTPYVLAAIAITAATSAVCWTASHLEADPVLHEVALFAHLASLVVGFGAVLAVDWVALQWLLGRRMLRDVLRTAGEVHVPIWIGYSGLVLSGVLLSPDLTSPATQLKLVLVLVIGWNGLVATWLRRRLGSRAGGPAILGAVACAGISQVAWWGAAAIGFLNAR